MSPGWTIPSILNCNAVRLEQRFEALKGAVQRRTAAHHRREGHRLEADPQHRDPQTGEKPARVNGVKNIIAISSGKGGVGKSSTAVNLALALAAEGAKVGILDADIYGPSIPTMLGAEDSRPTSPDGTHMAPIMKYGLATNSIGIPGDRRQRHGLAWADGQQGADADAAGDAVAGS
ncbi:putative ATP-binding protein [Klebsiella pneumoniae]|uniref:Putative ATP-binding protein n=1 Tax=Klebsiella pneumoniae TaxID=573 RepID=A0A377U149_KLEPN|nr:putative ATP-binding protein [Klebsiella pneumoniae]